MESADLLKKCIPPNVTADVIFGKSRASYNVILLLHGFGDSNLSFTNMAHRLHIPWTSYISLRAPYVLPLGTDNPGGNWMWGEDVHFDQNGDVDMEADFSKSLELLELIVSKIESSCEIPSRRIFLLGFGQGGMVALKFAEKYAEERHKLLGGVMSFGSSLPLAISLPKRQIDIPILVAEKQTAQVCTMYEKKRLQQTFSSTKFVCWNRKDRTEMPCTPEEWYKVIEWLSQFLYSRSGVPENAISLTD
ncbi:phospholipase [Schizosaccharomyces japonicus yFS275]|uniref:Phospholipase n=1 Tax=Schizosaccharomyces japonicus (strain yFS275 / FY16936) TaxID=402676 RepID=B6K428_SCHJY|nr:phospholipase [Schizosaccharomyces japonicus yFS275]EEB08235.1 phospholipase [Schizosaccharomyces japonicus yFS275]